MLEFSDQPYQYFPPEPHRGVQKVIRYLNRKICLPGPTHRISGLEVTGNSALHEIRSSPGSKVIFTPNHSTRSDPHILTESTRRIGFPCVFMAAYDVFLRSKSHRYILQKSGSFSVNRDAPDRRAIQQAIDTLQSPDASLTIFPEGNVWYQNDRIHPFLPGAAFIAFRSLRKVEPNAGPLWIVPTSVKATFIKDDSLLIRNELRGFCKAQKIEVPDDLSPIDLVTHIGVELLKRKTGEDFDESNPQIHVDNILKGLSADMEIELEPDRAFFDHFSRLRSKIHSYLANEDKHDISLLEKARDWNKKAMLAAKIYAYTDGYLADNPTVDRFGERVTNLIEDYSGVLAKPLSRRHVHVRFHDPVQVNDYIKKNGSRSDAVKSLTATLESTVQSGIDQFNQANPWAGGQLAQ